MKDHTFLMATNSITFNYAPRTNYAFCRWTASYVGWWHGIWTSREASGNVSCRTDTPDRVSRPGGLPGSITKSAVIPESTHSFVHPFHRHVQNATFPCCSQELLPFLSVIYPFPPTSLPSSLPSSCHLFLGLSLVVSSQTLWQKIEFDNELGFLRKVFRRSKICKSPFTLTRRLRWSSGSHAGLWFPSSRVQTRPKQLDFSVYKNPQHAFLRRGSSIICPMSQLCGM
jgi:hypothetical protein